MKTKRDIEKMVAGMELNKGSKKVVIQYGKGMLDGMHMAYVSVARKMLSEGSSVQDVRRFLADMTDTEELKSILADAQGEK